MPHIIENASLKAYNTFGINATARYFSSFAGVEDMGELLGFAHGRRLGDANGRSISGAEAPPLILGGGSNVLLQEDVDRLVLLNRIRGIDLVLEDEHHYYVKAGAGENWHEFVRYCLGRDWAGVENLSLIPGNVGAAPMQNIGAYGVEIKEVFHELQAWSLEDGKVYTFSLNDCQFGYRDSIFKGRNKGRFVILNVTFRLNKVPEFHIEYGAIREELEKRGIHQLSIQAISDAVIHIRQSKLPDPAEIGNAGSFFKNPVVPDSQFAALRAAFPGIVGYANTAPASAIGPGSEGASPSTTKIAAGWLIEQCGWKGFRRGDAGCHVRQALVLVNYGNATGKEIYDLSEEILQSVKARFGVTLEREVNII